MNVKYLILSGLKKTINSLSAEEITSERKEILRPLVEYIQSKIASKDPIQLNFICTHNSRRSHLAQIWAQAMAVEFGITKLSCYSGGTETTAIYPMVLEILKNNGFEIESLTQGENSIYAITISEEFDPIIAYSKSYGDPFNPTEDFAAIMTCSSADVGCPVVAGADLRIPITYVDPKVSDGTPLEKQTYLERSLEIATEMKWVFSQL